MTGHTSGNRVNGEFNFYAFALKGVGKLFHFLLRLGKGHTITGNDDGFFGTL